MSTVTTQPPSGSGSPPSGAPTAETIVRLGDYYLIRKLAQGGMAEIYLAKKLGVGGFEKTLVLKRMLDSLSGSPEFVGMFFDEARLAAKLTHPNIAQIYDFGVIENRYYIAMEHIPGEDARAILTRCWEQKVKIPVGIAIKVMIDVLAGLEYAHELEESGKPLGVIHRDVSPSNIMVSYQGAVKLVDFGIAKATSRMSETLTGNVKGKYSFLSPEQIEGNPIDARSDLFALGISFFELLTKRRPFRRDNELATIHAILHDEIPDPRAMRDNLPDDVAVIVQKALARNPADRYQSAALMRADLQTALTRIAPGLGQADLVKFMLALFGRDERERKTFVPVLGEDVALGQLIGKSTPMPGTPGMSGPGTGLVPLVLSSERPAFATQRMAASAVLPATSMTHAVGEAARRGRHRVVLVGALAGAAGVAAAALVMSSGPVLSRMSAAPVAPSPAPAVAPTPTPTPPAVATARVPVPTAVAPPPPDPAPPPAAVKAPPRAELQPLSGATLQTIVKRAQGRLSGCFKQHSDQLPDSQGDVTIELAVDAAGKVTHAATATAKIDGSALASCLVDEARRIKFPRHPDRELRFNFALVYRKDE